MHDPNFTPASYLKNYFILFLIFVISHILLLMVMVIITDRNTNTTVQLNQPKVYIVIAIIVTFYLIASYIFKKKITAIIKSTIYLKEKLLGHRIASTIKYLILEIPVFFSLLYYNFTGDIVYLLLASMVIIYFISLKPKMDMIADELQLSREERLALQKENKEIE